MAMRDKEARSLVHSAARAILKAIWMGEGYLISEVTLNQVIDSFPGRGNDPVYSSPSGKQSKLSHINMLYFKIKA